jgi:two-component system sensor histidine kinase UhpB
VHGLYPVALQHLPLAEAFGLLVSKVRQGIDCRLRVSAQLPALSGPQDICTACCRKP